MRGKKISVAFICAGDATDRRFSSGVYFYMRKALIDAGCRVESLGPVRPLSLVLGKWLRGFSRHALGKNLDFLHTFPLSKAYARFFRRKVLEGDFDIVFAQEAATEIAFLDVPVPIVYASDSTFALMKDYYPFFSNLLACSARQSDAIEGMAIKRADALVYPTHWAATSAIRDYGAERESISIVPFGPNFDQAPGREEALAPKDMRVCNLLFVGRNWARKGGATAVEAFLELRRAGVPARLTICGCTPPNDLSYPNLDVIPFLDKNDEEQRRRFMGLYSEAHFYILPSRAETAGFTVSEAAAFGVPVLASRTGGLADLVKEGENGYLLPLEAKGAAYARIIREIFLDPAAYSRLRETSRKRFEERLNWEAWAGDILDVFEACLSGGSKKPHAAVAG